MAFEGRPTAQLCDWVCSTKYEDLPAAVRKETATLIYDQVGCMIASALLPTCQPVVKMVQALGGPPECTILGHPLRAPITSAAFANGTIGHGAETDSTGQQGTGHYAASAVPTALTVGQYTKATGQELVRALALGAEVAARLQSVMFQFATRDLFYASNSGALGAAVNAGVLLQLAPKQMEHALGLAASGACGLTSHHLEDQHQTKSLDRGRASAAGVLSALLASQDFQGPPEILTAENGFFDAFLGVPQAGHQVVKDLGETYLMREVAYKRYPVGAPNQTPLYALLKMIQQNHLAAEDIQQIEVSISQGAFHVVATNQHPSVHMETILSLAAVYGAITFDHIYDDSYRADPRYQAFRQRVPIIIIPREGAETRGQRLNSVITLRTIRGEVFRQDLRYPPMNEEELKQKFRALAGRRLEESRVLDLERQLLSIDTVSDVAPLVGQLELPY
jgi:2-methylcitrate dehydratase PrpD